MSNLDHVREERKERLILDEIAFWGLHAFRESSLSLGCLRCGWLFHDAMHVGDYIPAEDW